MAPIPCSYILGIPLEYDCYNSPLIFAESIGEGNGSEPSRGDSGGGLFFNVDIGCVDTNVVTSAARVIGGVLSSWHEAEDTRSRWASFGLSQKWICDRLHVPPSRLLADARTSNDAIYAQGAVGINDRARVVADASGSIGATITAGASVNIGVDAVVGTVRANGNLTLRERAQLLGSAQMTGNLIKQNGTTLRDGMIDGLCSKIEPVSLTAPFPPGTTDLEVLNPRGHGGIIVQPAQWIGIYGEWRGTLVAPKATVVADMRDGAKSVGSFFVGSFTLHQGRWLQASGFQAPWTPTCDSNRTNCH